MKARNRSRMPGDVMVQLEVSGGHVPIWDELARIPPFTLYADRKLFLARRSKSTFGWEMLTAELPEEEAERIVSLIVDENRFFDISDDYEKWPAPVDLPTTHISVNHRGRKRTISVEGLIAWRRDESESWVSDRTRDELDRLSNIAHNLVSFTCAALEPYEPERLVVFAMIGHPDSGIGPAAESIPDWPVGEVRIDRLPRDKTTGIARALVTGPAVGEILHLTGTRNYFRRGKEIFLVSARPLLPHEESGLE